jgi:KDO2-lipid IV(A) lauroyltransferase
MLLLFRLVIVYICKDIKSILFFSFIKNNATSILYLLYYLISFYFILPFRLLYLLSDAVFFYNFYVARYRKWLAILLALPHLSKRAILSRKILSTPMRYVFEMIKTLSISKEMEKRFFKKI